ncbi:hypothetical protein EJ08DRAFT_729103 [Tothia fuscella]|uniref:Uncharacterized protein n=1 Tax=Tothia fuscella TaxID=1048955 RepID=A0A9P4P487_9PEZI|nr:hypothetical protein EJ08DRAFT_729103 [Tothia fuscella]
MDSALIVSIVLAIVSLLGTIGIGLLNFFSESRLNKRAQKHDIELQDKAKELTMKLAADAAVSSRLLQEESTFLQNKLNIWTEDRSDKKQIDALIQKYGQPLMVAAYELQARLYEICQYPISKAHLESTEGLQDIKQYTCYKFAQFLAWTHVLRTKAQFFSFTGDENLRRISYLILRIDEEFDRRRGYDGENVGVWPGSRVLISERMLVDVKKAQDVPADTTVIGFDEFLEDWQEKFRQPMSYFCHWIDDLVIARKVREQHKDDALRCTQHNLVDLVEDLDKNKIYHHIKKLPKRAIFCDCSTCNTENNSTQLRYRSESRQHNQGLRPWYIYEKWNPNYDRSIQLEAMQETTCKADFNPSLYSDWASRPDWRQSHWRDNDKGEHSDEEGQKVSCKLWGITYEDSDGEVHNCYEEDRQDRDEDEDDPMLNMHRIMEQRTRFLNGEDGAVNPL